MRAPVGNRLEGQSRDLRQRLRSGEHVRQRESFSRVEYVGDRNVNVRCNSRAPVQVRRPGRDQCVRYDLLIDGRRKVCCATCVGVRRDHRVGFHGGGRAGESGVAFQYPRAPNREVRRVRCRAFKQRLPGRQGSRRSRGGCRGRL